MVTRPRAGPSGIPILAAVRDFSLHQNVQTGAEGPSKLLYSWCWGTFQVVKRSGREVDRPSPASAELKNEWSYASTPPIRLHVVHRGSFKFTVFPDGS